MSDLLRIVPKTVGDNSIICPDTMLEANKAQFYELILVGLNKDGEIQVCASHSKERAFWILEKAKAEMLTWE